MTYTEYLKSHFGEDGSLARVLQELEKRYKGVGEIFRNYDDPMAKVLGGIYAYSIKIIVNKQTIYRNCNLFDCYSLSPETQRKIAELIGWKE